jgi:serine/threonine-protein kinase
MHRDIKPANLMVTELGGSFDVIKLLDFGLAKPIVASLEENENTDLTVAGSLTGSPLYMSPEQAIGDVQPDQRSDIYALGGVAFFMLTGRPPFDHTATVKILLAHAHEQPVAPSTVRPPGSTPMSPEFDALVLKCLEKSTENRFQSARELLAALHALPESNHWTQELAEQWWTCNCTHYQSQNG